jgi:hypothetical protein
MGPSRKQRRRHTPQHRQTAGRRLSIRMPPCWSRLLGNLKTGWAVVVTVVAVVFVVPPTSLYLLVSLRFDRSSAPRRGSSGSLLAPPDRGGVPRGMGHRGGKPRSTLF